MGLLQDFAAGDDVVAHDDELLVSELTRLVQDFVRRGHLADVVQQTAQAGLAHRLLVHAGCARERHHQRAHAHRVHESVFVLGLDAAQRQHGPRVAQDRVGDLFHHRVGLFDRYLPAQAGIVQEVANDLVRFGVDLAGLAEAHVDIAVPYGSGRAVRPLRFAHGRNAGFGGRGRFGDIQAAVGVDIEYAYACIGDTANRPVPVHAEALTQERMRDPPAVQAVNVHAGPEIPD